MEINIVINVILIPFNNSMVDNTIQGIEIHELNSVNLIFSSLETPCLKIIILSFTFYGILIPNISPILIEQPIYSGSLSLKKISESLFKHLDLIILRPKQIKMT